MAPLPIEPVLPELLEALREVGAVVLEAPPGAGKTTRVPPAVLGALPGGEVLVAEPRRIAARLAARRVAAELGEDVGGLVGYAVRGEERATRRTRLRFVTEGILLQRLLGEPRGWPAAVILDEFHERHWQADVALALLERRRRDAAAPWTVVMSATLDAAAVADFLGGCPRVRSEGRTYPLTVHHLPRKDDRPLAAQVAAGVRSALEQTQGNVLVFLPGAGEIRRAAEALGGVAASGVDVRTLHGDQPLDEQARVLAEHPGRRVVLSTNVAESSLTVPGVTAVVDSGLARTASSSPWTGLPRLTVGPISRASATQRAGRAGRVAPGQVFRLFTHAEFLARPEGDAPEVLRMDLAELVLPLRRAGLEPARDLRWLTPPLEAGLAAADVLLERLGLARDGALTTLGHDAAALPAHPRLARLVLAGADHGVRADALLAAAVLGERDPRRAAREPGQGPRGPRGSAASDLAELLDVLDEAERLGDPERAARRLGLVAATLSAIGAARKALAVALGGLRRAETPRATDPEAALGRAIVAAFPDRVALRPSMEHRRLVLCNGVTAELAEESAVQRHRWLVALDVDEQGAGGRRTARVRAASALEPDWLLDLPGDLLREEAELTWSAERGRVERLERLRWGSVVIDEAVTAAPPSPEAAALLVQAALSRRALPGLDDLEALQARLRFLASVRPELGLTPPDDRWLASVVASACAGDVSLAGLSAAALLGAADAALPANVRQALASDAPASLPLAHGRRLAIHYDPDRPPWAESRLQDFFGMASVPSLGAGRVPLTLHLLAPNHRAVQVTNDLAGFWARHYPSIRKELMRKYPRHAWPEDGATARPPEPRPRRSG